MKTIYVLLLLLFPALAQVDFCAYAQTQSYSEFYCDVNGNNLNSGSDSNVLAKFSATAGFFTNNTSASSCTWTMAGQTFTNVSVNVDWAAVYTNVSTTNVFIGLVTSTSAYPNSITISLKNAAGVVPPSDFVGNTAIRIGAAWKGPNTNAIMSDYGFPFNFATNSMTNLLGNCPCVNFRSGTYYTSNAISINYGGPIVFQGYTNYPHDLGKATLAGTVTPGGTYSIILLANKAVGIELADFTLNGNGNSGIANGFVGSANPMLLNRIVVQNMRGWGMVSPGIANECECFNNGLGGTYGGISCGAYGALLVDCYSHNNTGAGIALSSVGTYAIGCLSESNSTVGINISYNGSGAVYCSTFTNGTAGIQQNPGAYGLSLTKNCDSFGNGTFGYDSSASSATIGAMYNDAAGAGSATNSSGNISAKLLGGNLSGIDIQGFLTYGAGLTPWVDPVHHNFTMTNNAAGRAAGRRIFTQTLINSPTNTVSYPDIGATQSASTNTATSSGGSAKTWMQ